MIKSVKSVVRSVFFKFLKLLGIASLFTAIGCDGIISGEIFPDEGVAMYGVPTNVYTVSGTVKDNDGKAVKGIRVGIKKSPDDKTEYDEWDFKAYRSWEEVDEETGQTYIKYERSDYFEYVETDENGDYKLEWRLWPKDNAQFVLYAEDIDGEQNGSFKEKSSEIQFTGKDRTQDNSWVDYYEKKNVSISLDKDNPAQ